MKACTYNTNKTTWSLHLLILITNIYLFYYYENRRKFTGVRGWAITISELCRIDMELLIL